MAYKTVSINVDENRGIFPKDTLNEDEVVFLLNKDYIISSHYPLNGKQKVPYLLKPNPQESPGHFFLIKAIEEYLSQHTENVRLYRTVKPDIIFEAKGKKIAIEVETGSGINDRRRMIEKCHILNKTYSDWFFVVSRAPLLYRYRAYGKAFTRKNVRRKIDSYFAYAPPRSRGGGLSRVGKMKIPKNRNDQS